MLAPVLCYCPKPPTSDLQRLCLYVPPLTQQADFTPLAKYALRQSALSQAAFFKKRVSDREEPRDRRRREIHIHARQHAGYNPRRQLGSRPTMRRAHRSGTNP